MHKVSMWISLVFLSCLRECYITADKPWYWLKHVLCSGWLHISLHFLPCGHATGVKWSVVSICHYRCCLPVHLHTITKIQAILLVLNTLKVCETLKNCLVCASLSYIHSTNTYTPMTTPPLLNVQQFAVCICEMMICFNPHGSTCIATLHAGIFSTELQFREIWFIQCSCLWVTMMWEKTSKWFYLWSVSCLLVTLRHFLVLAVQEWAVIGN